MKQEEKNSLLAAAGRILKGGDVPQHLTPRESLFNAAGNVTQGLIKLPLSSSVPEKQSFEPQP